MVGVGRMVDSAEGFVDELPGPAAARAGLVTSLLRLVDAPASDMNGIAIVECDADVGRSDGESTMTTFDRVLLFLHFDDRLHYLAVCV